MHNLKSRVQKDMKSFNGLNTLTAMGRNRGNIVDSILSHTADSASATLPTIRTAS